MKKNKMTRGRRLGVCGLAACVALAMGFGFFGSEPGSVEAKDATQKKIEKTYPELVKSSEDSHTLSKDETAYEIMDADGNTKEIQVSEWLKNGTDAGTIKDVSELKDIMHCQILDHCRVKTISFTDGDRNPEFGVLILAG